MRPESGKHIRNSALHLTEQKPQIAFTVFFRLLRTWHLQMAPVHVLCCVSVLLATFYLTPTESAGSLVSYTPNSCCYGFQQHPPPVQILKEWYPTSPACPKPGVILLTKRGRQICADPSKNWVRQLMQRLPAIA